MTEDYTGLVKSLRWLSYMFPETHPAKDDTDRISNNIHLYCKSAAEAIESLENKLNLWRQDKISRWIPVTERLPPAEKEVYVTDGEYIARANLLDEVFPGDKPCWSYSGLGEITHWCEQIPLPQPPKEEPA